MSKEKGKKEPHTWNVELDPERDVIVPTQARKEIEKLFMLGISERKIAKLFNIKYGSLVGHVSNQGLRVARERYRKRSMQEYYEDWTVEHAERQAVAAELAARKAEKVKIKAKEAAERREEQEWLAKYEAAQKAARRA